MKHRWHVGRKPEAVTLPKVEQAREEWSVRLRKQPHFLILTQCVLTIGCGSQRGGQEMIALLVQAYLTDIRLGLKHLAMIRPVTRVIPIIIYRLVTCLDPTHAHELTFSQAFSFPLDAREGYVAFSGAGKNKRKQRSSGNHLMWVSLFA